MSASCQKATYAAQQIPFFGDRCSNAAGTAALAGCPLARTTLGTGTYGAFLLQQVNSVSTITLARQMRR